MTRVQRRRTDWGLPGTGKGGSSQGPKGRLCSNCPGAQESTRAITHCGQCCSPPLSGFKLVTTEPRLPPCWHQVPASNSTPTVTYNVTSGGQQASIRGILWANFTTSWESVFQNNKKCSGVVFLQVCQNSRRSALKWCLLLHKIRS